jgi:diamine N-acetyltransferase
MTTFFYNNITHIFVTTASLSLESKYILQNIGLFLNQRRMLNGSFQYLKASDDHIEQLIEFGKASFTRTFGHLYTEADLTAYLENEYIVENFSYWIHNENCCVFTVFDEKFELVGYSLATIPCKLPLENCEKLRELITTKQFGEIKKLYLSPSVFGTGIGQSLLMNCIEWFRSINPDYYICLNVFSENYRAIRFYCKHGFEVVGEYGFAVGDTIDREFIMCLLPNIEAPHETK